VTVRAAPLLLVLVACGSPQTTSPVGGGDAPQPRLSEDNQELLDTHNRYRAEHCAPPLRWSDDLAASAQRTAEQLMATNCAGEDPLTPGTISQCSPTDSAEQVVGMWYLYAVDYYDFTDHRSSEAVVDPRDFTQLLWKGTERVGCAWTRRERELVWVCHYDPPGNIAGAYEQNVLPTSCR
jgi:hypothetical protein